MSQRQVCNDRNSAQKRHSIYALNDKRKNKNEVMFLGRIQKNLKTEIENIIIIKS